MVTRDRRPGSLVALAIGLVLLTLVSGAQSAWVARQDARHAAEQRREADRLADCVRRVIRTLNERAAFTGPLDELDQADDQNLDTMIAQVTDQRLPVAERRAALAEYRVQLAAIRKRQADVRTERATHTFPTLEDCE